MSKFKYNRRDPSKHRDRVNQQSGRWANPIREGIKEWRPAAGNHSIRILPPTWEDADHYAYDVWVVWNVGADKEQYVTSGVMKSDENDPLAKALQYAKANGDDDAIDALSPSRRCWCWVIVSGEENEGPQLWSMPQSVDQELAKKAYKKRSREIIWLDDPEDCADIDFTVKGTGLKKKYEDFEIIASIGPVSKDSEQVVDWIKYIQKNPIPDCIRYYDHEHIARALEGGVGRREKADEEDAPRTRSAARKRIEDEEEEEAPRTRKRRQKIDDGEEEPPKTKQLIEDDGEELAPRKRKAKRESIDDADEDLDKPKDLRQSVGSGGLRRRRRRTNDDD